MKKKKYGYKLSRGKGARSALFRGLTRSLVEHGSIVTTRSKAKAVRPEIEKLVRLARKGGVPARRRVYARLANDRKTSEKLFREVAKAFGDRSSGFVKLIPLGSRRGDLAKMTRLEWSVDVKPAESTKKGKSKKTGKEPEKRTNKNKVLNKLNRRKSKRTGKSK